MSTRPNPIEAVTDHQIRTALASLVEQGQEFTTLDVIVGILGFYQKDVGAPGGASPNALFGKRLMKYAHEFGIVRVPLDRTVSDHAGGTTTAAIWRSPA